MALSTYAELKASIANWLFGRTDLTAVIPDFISMAEAEFDRVLRTRHQIVRAVSDLPGTQYHELPTDWLEGISIQVESSNGAPIPIEYRSPPELDLLRIKGTPAYGTAPTTPPSYYSIVGDQLELYPVPEAGTEIEMVYYRTIPKLSDSNTSNWLLTKAPDLYLGSSLLRAAPFVEDDERIAIWGPVVDRIMEQLRLESWNSQISGGVLVQPMRTFG